MGPQGLLAKLETICDTLNYLNIDGQILAKRINELLNIFPNYKACPVLGGESRYHDTCHVGCQHTYYPKPTSCPSIHMSTGETGPFLPCMDNIRPFLFRPAGDFL